MAACGRHIEAIILAAGESARMGFPKPLLRIDNETFIGHLVKIIEPLVSRVIVVIGAHKERVRPAIPSRDNVTVIVNDNFARGQLSSIKVGLRAVLSETDAVMIHLADHPMILPATIERLVRAYTEGNSPILITRYRGRRGHPVIFGQEVFEELLRTPEDVGARAVVNADPARVAYIDVDDPGVCVDLDIPSDLIRAGLPPPPSV
jgi:molybdenum cofactor cytidylyltransferase